jgi:hypothetical protein
MDAGLPGPAQVNARVASLVERGLERYGAGDLAGAMGEWEHALALDPAASQAKEYIDYVRDNFATLDEQFRAASAIKDSSRAAGVPMPEEPEEVSGAYDLVELEEGQMTPVGASEGAGRKRAPNGELGVAVLPQGGSGASIDEGWGMDDLAAPLPPPPPTAAEPLAPPPLAGASALDEDLAAVAAGLQIRDTGAPIPTLDEPPEPPAEDEEDEGPGQVVEMDADEPDPAEAAAAAAAAAIDVPDVESEPLDGEPDGTQVPTLVGGSEPPPLPERPELSPEAIAALGGRVPTLTINPRTSRAASEGTGAGTVPGYVGHGSSLPEDAQTPIPGELPAPPHVATPSELVLELGSLDASMGDESAPTERLGPPEPETPYYPTGELRGDHVGSHPGEILAEPGESSYDGGGTAAPTNSIALPAGVGEPISAGLLGLSGDDTGEATRPTGAKRALELLPEDLAGESELSGPPEMSLDLGDADFDDQPRTAERLAADAGARSPFAGDTAAGLAEGTDDRARVGSPAGAPAVIVDEQLLRGVDDSGDEITNARARLPSIDEMGIAGPGAGALPRAASQMPTNARAALPDDLPGDSDEDRIRRRVSELLSLAREAAERGDHLHAVEAAEAASVEDPDGKIGPVILHRHRDLLYRIYEGHIGEMTQVPLLAVPLHQIAAERLDHRTGFLLSRIDGLLSFEDILDVAGMPRLDAYRILSNLLRRGFIEVR